MATRRSIDLRYSNGGKVGKNKRVDGDSTRIQIMCAGLGECSTQGLHPSGGRADAKSLSYLRARPGCEPAVYAGRTPPCSRTWGRQLDWRAKRTRSGCPSAGRRRPDRSAAHRNGGTPGSLRLLRREIVPESGRQGWRRAASARRAASFTECGGRGGSDARRDPIVCAGAARSSPPRSFHRCPERSEIRSPGAR